MMDGPSCARELWSGHVQAALASFGVDGCGAALLGPGSEVLGFDDDRSRDHDFGPQLQVFVPKVTEVDGRRIEEQFDAVLPEVIGGYPVRFPVTADPVRRHRVTVTTVARFFAVTCGVDPTDGLSVDEWLRTPTQLLASVTAGEVFADRSGEIARCRAVLAWYPDDVWRHVLGCQWRRLAQLEPFLGRTAEAGDDLGARMVAARLTNDLMRLAFLLERRWAPYAKWLGSAFGQLDVSPEVAPDLTTLVSTASPQEREQAYLAAGVVLAVRFNALGLTAPVDAEPQRLHTRPYWVLGADRFALACHDGSPLAALGWRGAVDQWVDNTDILTNLAATAPLYPPTLDLPTVPAGLYRLRVFRFDDLDVVREASEDPFIPVLTTIPSEFTDQAGRAFIERQWSRPQTGEGYSWAIAEFTWPVEELPVVSLPASAGACAGAGPTSPWRPVLNEVTPALPCRAGRAMPWRHRARWATAPTR